MKQKKVKPLVCPKCNTSLHFPFMDSGKCLKCGWTVTPEAKSQLNMLLSYVVDSVKDILAMDYKRIWLK